MEPDLHSRPELRQEPIITPELREAIELLTYSALELEEYIKDCLQKNPVLEREDYSCDQGQARDYDLENMVAHRPGLLEYLEGQLSEVLEEREIAVGRYILGSLDEDGLLAVSPEQIAEDFSFSREQINSIISRIKRLDPPGVASETTREALLAQLEVLEVDTAVARDLLKKHYDEIICGEYRKVLEQVVDQKKVKKILQKISKLNPSPAAAYREGPTEYILPDLVVERDGDEFTVRFTGSSIPVLRLSDQYRRLYRQVEGEEKRYLEKKISSARRLLQSIDHRRQTICRMMQFLTARQEDFFLRGVKHLHPLTMKEAAAALNVHESTVSRAAANKYVQTPHGIFELKFFFSGGEGNFSRTSIKSLLAVYIKNEDRNAPYSDRRLVELLEEREGINISRRTVAEYRKEMNIPGSRERKKAYHQEIF